MRVTQHINIYYIETEMELCTFKARFPVIGHFVAAKTILLHFLTMCDLE